MSFEINSFLNLKAYCENEEYKGWDPYDGLNSKLLKATSFDRYRLIRLAWIQFFKKSPFNLRRFVGVSKGVNPKGLGLFLTGYCNLLKAEKRTGNQVFGTAEEILERIVFLAELLLELRANGFSGDCWGYNFDWQNRVFFQPKYTPTVVVTSFCADSMFNAYEATGDRRFLSSGLSSVKFIENDLNRSERDNELIFSYSPKDHSKVYNASLLGARLVARGYQYNKNNHWKELALQAAQTIAKKQQKNGSWVYGENKVQGWIDSFHTGFNLECLYEIDKYTGSTSNSHAFDLGLKFYIDNFFLGDGTPKYFHNKTYPIDIHSPAQFIATLSRTKGFETNQRKIDLVIEWTLANMRSKEGYFYYQKNRFFTSKIPYIRWSQAWMFYGLSEYLKSAR